MLIYQKSGGTLWQKQKDWSKRTKGTDGYRNHQVFVTAGAEQERRTANSGVRADEVNKKPHLRKAWTVFFHNNKEGEFQSRTYLTRRSAVIFYVKTVLTNSNAKMTSLYVRDERSLRRANTGRASKKPSKKAAKKARSVLALSGTERDGVP